MPKIAYSEAEREQIKEALITEGLELFAKQGVQHTTVEQIYKRVGISRTFFYSFFPAKEDLIVQVFCRQRPRIVEHARRLMEDPDLSWHDGVRQFLHDFCYVREGRFAIMTVEEQKSIFKHLSEDNYAMLREKQVQFFSDILKAFGIIADDTVTKLLSNLLISAAVVRKAIPGSLPFLFEEVADEMVVFQIDSILRYMEKLRNQQNK